jgi:hypothetical protein
MVFAINVIQLVLLVQSLINARLAQLDISVEPLVFSLALMDFSAMIAPNNVLNVTRLVLNALVQIIHHAQLAKLHSSCRITNVFLVVLTVLILMEENVCHVQQVAVNVSQIASVFLAQLARI